MNIKSLIPQSLKTILKMSDGYIVSSFNRIAHPDFRCDAITKRCFSNPKSPNYKYEYFGKDTPMCCATNLYTILKDVAYVLEENGIEYFISFGTLLGAVRHGGMIPWDTDVDILISESKKEEVIKILNKSFKTKSYKVHEDYDEKIVGSIIRVDLSEINTLHVDLFTYIEEDKKIIFGYNRVFEKKEIFPLKRVYFYDLSLYAPKEIDKQLEIIYGKDYKIYGYKQWALNKKKFKLTSFKPAEIEL